MTTADDVDLAAFRSLVAAFLAQSVEDGVACPAFGAVLPPALHDRARAWQRWVYDAGFAGLHWPVAHGGRGLSRDHTAVWVEECARVAVAAHLDVEGLVPAGEAILRWGTGAQHERFLRPTLDGGILWCRLFAEPEPGGVRATALRADDGDGFVISGRKAWSPNAGLAGHGLLLARTNPILTGHRGVSCFVLDMATAGVEVGPGGVVLDRARVPGGALLGPAHDGWPVALATLADERGRDGTGGGAGLAGLERRLALLRSLVGAAPAHRDPLLRLYVRGRALHALLRRGDRDAAAATAAGVLRRELDHDVERLVTTVRGAESMLDSPATERCSAGSTREIQRHTIAERVLGFPREPW